MCRAPNVSRRSVRWHRTVAVSADRQRRPPPHGPALGGAYPQVLGRRAAPSSPTSPLETGVGQPENWHAWVDYVQRKQAEIPFPGQPSTGSYLAKRQGTFLAVLR